MSLTTDLVEAAMSRLPFDPTKVAGPEPVGTPERYTVSQVVELIKSTLEMRMPAPLRVVGQVSNFRSNKHWYFSLKDAEAVLHCVSWATAVRTFGFVPKDGDEVVASGHISHFGPQGKTQLYVEQLVPVGAGALELKFRALCEELRGLGYFDEARKKPLPVFPRKIAVITSAGGAALQDVIATAAQRCRAVGLLVVDVRVQGDGAVSDVAKAIRWVDAHHKRLGVDAMLVTRGGGSIEDLWAFNERIVADSVFKCSLPVVAAIGHESDTTIIELVADRRAATPTQAAMMLVPSAKDMHRHVEHVQQRLMTMVRRCVDSQRQRSTRLTADLRRIMKGRLVDAQAQCAQLGRRLAHLQPRVQVMRRQTDVAVLRDRLHRAMVRRIDQRPRVTALQVQVDRSMWGCVKRLRDQMSAGANRLSAVDPTGVLNRGYSITMTAGGAVVRSVSDVERNDVMMTRVRDGVIESVVGVTGVQASPARSRKRQSPSADQMDLFAAPR